MLWPDMTWVYIIAYDIWNFCYTYNCLPTHSWFCGFALLLAPTVAAFCWNKGGWIQNRAFTLAIWCMFAQVFPYFQEESIFVTHSTLNPTSALVVSILALVANVAAIVYIAYRAKKLGREPLQAGRLRGHQRLGEGNRPPLQDRLRHPGAVNPQPWFFSPLRQ